MEFVLTQSSTLHIYLLIQKHIEPLHIFNLSPGAIPTNISRDRIPADQVEEVNCFFFICPNLIQNIDYNLWFDKLAFSRDINHWKSYIH